MHEFLFLMSLNHLMTELVFFLSLISKDCLSGELMLPRMDLLTFPIWLFDGLYYIIPMAGRAVSKYLFTS